MKLATLKNGMRDGELVVVSRDLSRYVPVPDMVATLQGAMDRWESMAAPLRDAYHELNAGGRRDARPFDQAQAMSPLPRAYQWADGSAYVNHVELVRKARGADLPESFWTDPLMYQGGSDSFLGPREDIRMESEEWGIDFEAEVAVICGDVPMGASAETARGQIRLIMVQAVQRFFTRRGDARRAGRRLGRRGGPFAAGHPFQSRAIRQGRLRRRYDVRFPFADHPCGEIATALRGDDRGFGYRLKP
jgi:hypothetical protein